MYCQSVTAVADTNQDTGAPTALFPITSHQAEIFANARHDSFGVPETPIENALDAAVALAIFPSLHQS